MVRIFSSVVLVVGCAARADAQALSIAQAVDEALQHNLSLLAEKTALTIAEAQMIAARLRPNPGFSFSADHLDALGTGFDATNNGRPPENAWGGHGPAEGGGERGGASAPAAPGPTASDRPVCPGGAAAAL